MLHVHMNEVATYMCNAPLVISSIYTIVFCMLCVVSEVYEYTQFVHYTPSVQSWTLHCIISINLSNVRPVASSVCNIKKQCVMCWCRWCLGLTQRGTWREATWCMWAGRLTTGSSMGLRWLASLTAGRAMWRTQLPWYWIWNNVSDSSWLERESVC